MQPVRLDGIDGSHLWGFLSALGSLSLLDQYARRSAMALPRLSFQQDGIALLHTCVEPRELAGILLDQLAMFRAYVETTLASIKKPTDLTRSSYESFALDSGVDGANFLAGIACVVGEEAHESTLCAANGAGHQYLIQAMRDILNLVEEEHLRQSLFVPWQKAYRVPNERRKQLDLGDRKPTLRLDPADERLYALRFADPTAGDDYRTELGAQALAIPAFALLPVLPVKHSVTVASVRQRNRVTFSWPLWNVPAGLCTVRSLVWMGAEKLQIQRDRGIVAAFSADRVSGPKGKLSFTPSQGIW